MRLEKKKIEEEWERELDLQELSIYMNLINLCKSMDQIRKGYRAAKVKSHLIFYRISNETVEIIRILHERMDIDGRRLIE